jgi:hypothetical protein
MATGNRYRIWPKSFREKIEDQKGTYDKNLKEAFKIVDLKPKDYLFFYFMPNDNVYRSLFGRRALLQVSSLNNEGGQHMIYWDGRKLRDPSNKKTYGDVRECKPSRAWVLKCK